MKIGPILLFIGGSILLFGRSVGLPFPFLLGLTLLMVVLAVVVDRMKKTFRRFPITTFSQNIFFYEEKDTVKAGIVLRVVRKNTEKEDIAKAELEKLISSISKSDMNSDVYLVNKLKGKPGASVVVLSKGKGKDSALKNLTSDLKIITTLCNGICSNLELVEGSVSDVLVPIPRDIGNMPFAVVEERGMSIPKSSSPLQSYDVELGVLNDDYRTPFGIRLEDITRHIGIFGSTGTGKSTTASSLASKVSSRGLPVIILDWHGEYISKLPKATVFSRENIISFNPLSGALSDVDETVELIGDVLDLTDPQRYILFSLLNHIRKSGEPTMGQLLKALRDLDDTAYWMREVKYALARKLYVMYTRQGKMLFNGKGTPDEIKAMLTNNRLTIIDLSFISNIRLRRIFALFLVKLIADYVVKRKEKTPVLLILEEGENYFINNSNQFLEKLLSEIRKFGLGLCIVSQSPSSISPSAIKNTNTKIVHGIKSDVDKRIIRDSMSLPNELISVLDKLDKGYCVVQSPNLIFPVVAKIIPTADSWF